MSARRAAWPACGAAAVGLCAIAAGVADARPWGFGLGVGRTFADHRPGFSPAAHYSSTTLTPRIHFDGGTRAWELRFLAQRRWELGMDRALDSRVGSDDHTADRVSLFGRRSWSPYEEVRVDGLFTRSYDLLETEEGTLVPEGTVARWRAATAARIWRLEGDLATRGSAYGAGSLNDAHGIAFGGRFLALRDPRQALYVGGRHEELAVEDGVALLTRAAFLGYRRRLTPGLTAEVEAGYARARFGDGARYERPTLGLALETPGGSGRLLTWRLHGRFERDSLAAAGAEVRYRLASGRLWLRGESRSDIEGGLYRNPRATRRVASGVLDTLGRANVLSFEVSYERTRPIHYPGLRTNVMRSTAWYERRMQPWLSFRVGASYVRQPVGKPRPEEGLPSAPIYRRVRLDAELIALHR